MGLTSRKKQYLLVEVLSLLVSMLLPLRWHTEMTRSLESMMAPSLNTQYVQNNELISYSNHLNLDS